MITKSPRLLALGTVLLCSSVALAQTASPSPTGSGSSGSSSSGSETTTTTTTTIQAPIEPPMGTGIVSDTAMATIEGETLPATGGAPLLMALTGALVAGGALLGLKKVR